MKNQKAALLSFLLFAIGLACACPASQLSRAVATPTPVPSASPSPTLSPSPSPSPSSTPGIDCAGVAADIYLESMLNYEPWRPAHEEELPADVTELVMYQVEGDEISNPYNYRVSHDLEPYQQDTEKHRAIWNMFAFLIPPEQRQPYTRFTVITDGPGNILAATRRTSSQPDSWTLRVDIVDADHDESLANSLVHEFGHLLTLNGRQVDHAPTPSCATYGSEYLCSLPDSYLNQFFEAFWLDIYPEWQEIDALQDDPFYHDRLWEFYRNHADRFISPYASTHPEEDIAEALTYFFFMPAPPRQDTADEKSLFFYAYPELVELRALIQEQICAYFIPGEP